jgi:hypothetical protein
MPIPFIDLPAALPIVERAVAEHDAATAPFKMSSDYDAWRNARRKADAAATLHLSQLGAAIRDDWQGAAIRFAGVRSTSTGSLIGALSNWLTAARKKLAHLQDDCPGHVASEADMKICGRCGMHIDEMRPPDDDDDPFNPHGSGPVPIEPRED